MEEANTSQPPADAIGLVGFSVTNYQGITYAKVEDLNLASRWIFLTGENGFGKTSVLQALAHALAGPRDDFSYYDIGMSMSRWEQPGLWSWLPNTWLITGLSSLMKSGGVSSLSVWLSL